MRVAVAVAKNSKNQPTNRSNVRTHALTHARTASAASATAITLRDCVEHAKVQGNGARSNCVLCVRARALARVDRARHDRQQRATPPPPPLREQPTNFPIIMFITTARSLFDRAACVFCSLVFVRKMLVINYVVTSRASRLTRLIAQT